MTSSPAILEDKVALVTGGSRGLGLAMCRAFADAGARVVIVSRKAEQCVAAAKQIERETGREALGLSCHVGHWDDLARTASAVVDRFGRIDVLVNNAGMSPQYPSLMDVTESLFDKVFDVNLKGPFRLSTLVGDVMVRGGGGSIINVSSIASVNARPETAPYAMAKAGVNTMTLALARAYAPTVRVNTIMAGPFETDISQAWDEATRRQFSSSRLLGRVGDPKEIVGAALYLASGASSYTTGSILTVDGGAR